MADRTKPIVIEFPLRGEWSAPNTPGTRVPSHGTNLFGTTYAYDFLQVDWTRRCNPCYSVSPLHYLLFGVPIDRCYCYGKEIYSPFGGTIEALEDGCQERERALLFSDFRRAKHNSKSNKSDSAGNDSKLTGNYIILKHSNGIYAAFCHLQPASIEVSVGQIVKKGQFLARVGHSGNSMFPHLHFQLMDKPDMTAANGLPCAFERYEFFKNGKWETTYESIPKATDRIRFMG